MPKGDKLTVKQKKFAAEYAKTGNKVQSALKAYDTDDYTTASVIAHETLEKPRVKEEVDRLMAALDKEITPEFIAQVHVEGLNASTELVVNGEKLGEIPDYKTRHKYLDTYYKVKQKIGGPSKAGTGNTFNFISNVGDDKNKYA